eukprot:scaffold485_cov272-Pinguiococcus_pyrenoidosus.AAC.11
MTCDDGEAVFLQGQACYEGVHMYYMLASPICIMVLLAITIQWEVGALVTFPVPRWLRPLSSLALLDPDKVANRAGKAGPRLLDEHSSQPLSLPDARPQGALRHPAFHPTPRALGGPEDGRSPVRVPLRNRRPPVRPALLLHQHDRSAVRSPPGGMHEQLHGVSCRGGALGSRQHHRHHVSLLSHSSVLRLVPRDSSLASKGRRSGDRAPGPGVRAGCARAR